MDVLTLIGLRLLAVACALLLFSGLLKLSGYAK
jgi:hypothetical protein